MSFGMGPSNSLEKSSRMVSLSSWTMVVKEGIRRDSDGETFISADDLRINLWNLEISNQSFNIVDVKPANMEDLTDVITSTEFHPTHCNMLAYSSSKGSIRLINLRQSALCDSHAKLQVFYRF
ncbi:serine/threonine protein phosphatase 2A 55 kDa regulatory subunit B alpha isoform [Gossypium raimondii]|uniref:serine/threonine protein phosphatase 2A 55 kDa regulatory subunit B alpha isoform n=1 Tax=Gossypium raimondii TaxID=29730 RepID=UPI00063AED9E|nr:serine/threonine protein phosphatase 2A 55 kDa regulatory subunit B alpha isoform [Gossypium raimondii]